MRTTLDIPEDLIKDAIHVSHAKTKTMAVIFGLQELINRHKLEQLRTLRGKIPLTTNTRISRKR
mgnify:CR=1 FL=1